MDRFVSTGQNYDVTAADLFTRSDNRGIDKSNALLLKLFTDITWINTYREPPATGEEGRRRENRRRRG